MLKNQVGNEEIVKKLTGALDGLDQHRSVGLATLKQFQTSRDAASKRELQRLTAKYGTDHPRVAAINARLAFTQKFAPALDAEVDRSETAQPDFDVNTWMVHGRVLDENGNAKQAITISLSDANGTWVRALGFVCSDAQGYYSIKYTKTTDASLPVPETQPLFLTATDANFKLLERSTRQLFLKIGQIDVVQLVLTCGGKCNPPQPQDSPSDPLAEAWVVRGRVIFDDKQPAPGLTINLIENKLGDTQTDNDGRFSSIFTRKAFNSLFEGKQELHLKVIDPTGKVLYASKKPVRCTPGSVEEFQITIKRKSTESGKGKTS